MNVGIKGKKPGYVFVERDHPQVQVIVVTSGELRMTTAKRTEVIHPGGMLFLGQHSSFTLFCEDESYQGIYVVEPEDNLPDRFRTEAFHLSTTPLIRQVVDLIDQELEQGGIQDGILEHLGWILLEKSLLAKRHQATGEPREAMAEYWAERLRQTIERNIFNDCPVGELFSGWSLSEKQLVRHFKASTGKTPKQYQISCRMDQGRQMLRETSLSVRSIALELGFPSSQHFATQFKKHCKISPLDFRKGVGR